ncbi:hypothetical protein CC86DRAFT_62209 [Ophiobolus disseminans]|uniref:Heterokaryon incompatibility domain-containing protein n=1 Tax=Ophiobolus disseminans TaxID=1469910 RepID=A0A6A6ZTL3_9PLEO|nr:hypothetical protein CC86DRAFT_62209 [Ophiobolus disseminans]
MDVDYSSNVQQTYQNFARACVLSGGGVAIIEAALQRKHSRCSDGWSSWVPDWRISPTKTSMPFEAMECTLAEANTLRVSLHHPWRFSNEGRSPRIVEKIIITDSIESFRCSIRVLSLASSSTCEFDMMLELSKLPKVEDGAWEDCQPFARAILGEEFILPVYEGKYVEVSARKFSGMLRKRCFLIAAMRVASTHQYPERTTIVMGVTNAAIQSGDCLAAYDSKQYSEATSSNADVSALVLRPTRQTRAGPFGLVGTAYILSPFVSPDRPSTPSNTPTFRFEIDIE